MKNKICKPMYDPKQNKWVCSACKVVMPSVAQIRECNDIMNLFGGLFKNKVK